MDEEHKSRIARIKMAARSSNTTVLIKQALEDALVVAASFEKLYVPAAVKEQPVPPIVLAKRDKELDDAYILLEARSREIADLRQQVAALRVQLAEETKKSVRVHAMGEKIETVKAVIEGERKKESAIIKRLERALKATVAMKEGTKRVKEANRKTGTCSTCFATDKLIVKGKCPACYRREWVSMRAPLCACGNKIMRKGGTKCRECWLVELRNKRGSKHAGAHAKQDG